MSELEYIRGVIAALPPQDRRGVEAAAQAVRALLARHNDYGLLALALVGAEIQAQG